MSAPRHPNTLVRALIRDNAPTAKGFQLADACGMEAASYASRMACRMVLAGQLWRCKVKRHPISYHATQEKADETKAAQILHNSTPKPVKVKAIKPVKQAKVKVIKVKAIKPPSQRKQQAAELRQLIIDKCTTPQGFCIHDVPPEQHCAAYKHLDDMRESGVIFRGQIAKNFKARYFNTAARADAWRLAQLLTKKPAAIWLRSKSKTAGPRVEAVISYMPNYKHTVYPTPAPRNTSYQSPFIRTGMREMA